MTSEPYQRDLRDENKQVREHYISWEKKIKKRKEKLENEEGKPCCSAGMTAGREKAVTAPRGGSPTSEGTWEPLQRVLHPEPGSSAARRAHSQRLQL